MKNVIISADGERMLYAVPDPVAENLREYCLEFCDHWLPESPDAAPYRRNGGLCYTEADFIEYLNQYQFPDEPSVLIKNLGFSDDASGLPEEYAAIPRFNF